jgi:YD repeat-containing protein
VVDLWLPGRLPLVLARQYRSDGGDGPFGHGWHFGLDVALRVESDRWVVREGSGREHAFTPIGTGTQAVHGESRLVLQHHPDAYVAYFSPLAQQVFPKKNASRGTIPVDHIIDPNGNRIQFRYEGGHLAAIIDSEERRIVLGRRGGRVVTLQVNDATGSETVLLRRFRYDAQGDLVAEGDAQGREARYTYQQHHMVAYTNRLGGTQYAQYEASGRCLALWNEDGSQVRKLDLDDHRQNTHVLNGMGYQTLYQHVMHQLVLQQVDAFGDEQNYYYDDFQQLRGYSTPDGDTATFQGLDVNDGTLTQIDGESRLAAFTFEEDGLARQVADSKQHTYRYQVDDQHTLTRLTVPQGGSWAFDRDRHGRVVQIGSPEGRRLNLRWDARERELVVSDDGGLLQRSQFDLLGRVVRRTDASGRAVQATYRPTGHLEAVHVGDQYAVQFDYNAEGLLTRVATRGGGTTSYQYDSYGRVVRWQPADDPQWQFRYDREGRIAAARSQQGQTAQIEYDWQGRVKQVTLDGQNELSYTYAQGPRITVQQNGTRYGQTYTPLMDPAEYVDAEGETTLQVEYGLTGEVVDAISERGAFSFTYDAQQRVSELVCDGTPLSCTYDRDGRLLDVQDEQGRRVELRYDRRGRLDAVQGDVQSDYRLRYDEAGRLQELRTPSGVRFQYAYDVLDRLVARRVVDVAGETLSDHHFDDGGAPVADAFDLQEDGAADEAGKARAVLLQGRHGLVLMVHLGPAHLPVWVQGDVLDRGAPVPLSVQIARACVQGPETLLRTSMPEGRALLDAWTAVLDGRLQRGLTQIPDSRDLGCDWPVLDAFFLDRAAYDYHFPRRVPGELPRHHEDRGRSADLVVTGTHMTDYLRPPAWDTHAVGPHLQGQADRFRRGGVQPEDVPLFFEEVS